MAKVIKYGDTSKIEDSGFKQAPVGLYHAKVETIEQKQSKNNNEPMVEVVFRLTKDANGKKLKESYGQLWYYAPLDPEASWARRLKDLITAFGLKSRNGNLGLIEGKEALVRLREDTDLNGDYRPTIGKVMALPSTEEEEDEDTEEEEEEEEEESENGLADLTRTQLKQLIKDEELEVTVRKSMSDDDIREAIEEARPVDEEEEDEEEPEEEDDEEEEEDEEEAAQDNYDSMTPKALRQELKDRELPTNGAKSVLVARLRTDDVEEPV